ncbi:MAG: DpnI domain-containing protein [Patescibacteria group bacterium]|jgi:type II restriction enzyme
MQVTLDIKKVALYKSTSQKIRVMTETWVGEESFCPACGSNINQYENNRKVADFYCPGCKEEYELKSQKEKTGNRIADGAYNTMLKRLKGENNPNFFFLNYGLIKYEVINFAVIPKHFFIPDIIVKRNQGLKDRPNYIMCSIDLKQIPESGKIFYIKNQEHQSRQRVLDNWQKTLFLREEKEQSAKGWILDVMNCVDRLGKKEFKLDEIYAFAEVLRKKHPNNQHIKDKIRQQMQFLRDKGYLSFVQKGKYKLN